MVDVAIVSALLEFFRSVWRPTVGVLVAAAVASVALSLATLHVSSPLERVSLVRAIRSTAILPLNFAFGLFGGLVAALYHRPPIEILVFAVLGAGAASIGWATVGSAVHKAVSPRLPQGAVAVAQQLGAVGVLVGVYFAYIGFRVHRTITEGLSPGQLEVVEPAATLFATKAVLPLYGILGAGIGLLLALVWFWDRTQPWLKDALAKRTTPASEPIKWGSLRDQQFESWTRGGLLLILGVFAWIILIPGPQDLVVGIIGGLAVIEVVVIFDSVRMLRGIDEEQYSDSVIASELKLQAAEITVYVFSIGGTLLVGALLVDVFTQAYYHAVLAPAASEFRPEVAHVLASGSGTPDDVLHFFDFYASGLTFFGLSVSLLKLLLPAIVAVFGIPFGVEYLYFRDYRTVVIAMLTLVGVLLLHVVIELVVSGEITHLTAISATSLLPTISAGLSGTVVEWFKEEVGHAHCPNCDTRIERSSNYCDHCGVRLVTCPNCDEFSAVEDGTCLICGATVDDAIDDG